MTQTITIRPRRSKAELRRKLGKNLSRRINDLIEREFSDLRDWREILDSPRPKVSDAVYATCLQPE
jgi:hypothetical protein